MATKASTPTKGKSSKTVTKTPTSGPAGGNTHKSFQPVHPCGNKLLQRKWDQTYYDEHRRLVKSARPMVDTRAPAARPHITSKLKKQQLQKERADEIDRDNINLLKKMQHIMHTQGQVDHKHTYKHHSLNQRQRQVELDRIAKENKQMLTRLEKVEPMYKVTDWIDDWRRKEELTEMITAFPEATKMDSPEAQSLKSSRMQAEGSVTSQGDEELKPTEDKVSPEDNDPLDKEPQHS